MIKISQTKGGYIVRVFSSRINVATTTHPSATHALLYCRKFYPSIPRVYE